MVTQWTRWLARLRRLIARNEWAVRLLGLPQAKNSSNEPGLVLIQIDGLGQSQLQKALAAGRMPTLQRLLKGESYRLHALYSGLPSSTPSMQGELFYGVRAIVPAFGFREPETGQVVSMLDADEAKRIEARLAEHGEGLLRDGSAYADVLTGGAEETHYCSANLGWGGAFRLASPWRLFVAAVLYTPSFLRVVTLLFIEAGLATFDFARGSLQGRGFWSELSCVPLRVGVSVLLRELCVFGASADVTRGVPIVHLNLLGYDEQAHRRGPGSAFAHWSLGGIDHAIQRVWNAAHRSIRRHYDVWIYSDHGQEACVPYSRRAGRTLEQAVIDLLDIGADRDCRSEEPTMPSRARWLGTRWFLGAWQNSGIESASFSHQGVQVAANGPLGFIYLNRPRSEDCRRVLAERLVQDAGCPFVLMRFDDGEVRYRTDHGWFGLGTNADTLLGADHPFLTEVAADLESLAKHPLAGDLMVGGWNLDGKSVSFARQNGAHAGPGPNETSAFALLPSNAPLGHDEQDHLRANDLRNAALRQLRRQPATAAAASTPDPGIADSLRLLSYNVHACVGMDGRLSPERIARVTARSQADVVALQELDMGRGRSDYQDQAQEIARLLEMDWHFHPAWALAEEQYGDAVLSRLPMRLVHSGVLPGPSPLGVEPRGAIWAEVELGENRVQIINTHLGLRRREQADQIEKLLGEDWLGAAVQAGPTILCGDYNFSPRSRPYRRVVARLRDAYDDMGGPRPAPTYCSWAPLLRIDHLFVCPRLRVERIGVVRTTLSRSASDHLPLLATLRIADSSHEKLGHPSRGNRRVDSASAGPPS